jgi:hypothetical protein
MFKFDYLFINKMFYRIDRTKTPKRFDPTTNIFKCTVNEVEQYFNDLIRESRRIKKEKTKKFLQENPLYGRLVIDFEFIGPKIVPRAEEPAEEEENKEANFENSRNDIENIFSDNVGNDYDFYDKGVQLIDKADEEINANVIEDVKESEDDLFVTQIKNNSVFEENHEFEDINAIDGLTMMDLDEPNKHDLKESKDEVMDKHNNQQCIMENKVEIIIQPKPEGTRSKFNFKKVEIFESNPEDDFLKSPKIRNLDL